MPISYAKEILKMLRGPEGGLDGAKIDQYLTEFPKLVECFTLYYNHPQFVHDGIENPLFEWVPCVVIAIFNAHVPWSIVEIFLSHGADIMQTYTRFDQNFTTTNIKEEVQKGHITQEMFDANGARSNDPRTVVLSKEKYQSLMTVLKNF